MKTLVIVVGLTLLSLVVFVSARANDAKKQLGRERRFDSRRCKWWKWWCYQNCEEYDEDTEYCCYPRRRGGAKCCTEKNKHAKPTCDSTLTYHKHECSCNMYWKCMDGDASEEYCPHRGAWDDANKECKEVTSRKRPDFCDSGSRFFVNRIPMVMAEYTIEVVDETGNEVISITDTAPYDVVFNVLKFIEGKRNDFSVTAMFDAVDWWKLQCLGSTCVDATTEWKFLVDSSDMTDKGVNKAIADTGTTLRFEKMNIA